MEMGDEAKIIAKNVMCYPLYSILQALNKSESIDYFSLDVEGNEVDILKTIPWNKVDIKTLSVEYHHIKGVKENQSPKQFLIEYMTSVGYYNYTTVRKGDVAQDVIFIHRNWLPKLNIAKKIHH